MRTAALFAGILVIAAASLQAGPCTAGTAADYSVLGLSGCEITVGGYGVTVVMGGVESGTNTSAATYPSVLSNILIDPLFSPLPGGFGQSFQITLVPGSWVGTPGQDLDFGIAFEVTLDHTVSAVTQTVTSGQSGTITSDICANGFYIFGFLCGGDEYKQDTPGTSATVSVGPHAPFATYGVSAFFNGILPNGTFDGITSATDVSTVPEPSSLFFLAIPLLMILMLRYRGGIKRGARTLGG